MSANLENSAVATEDWKKSVFIPVWKKVNAKECSNCSFHMLVRLCSKSSKLGFNSTWIENFQYKLCLEKAEEPEIKLPTLVNHGKSNRVPGKSNRVPGKHIYFCFIDCAKAFDCVDHNKLWTIFKEMGLPDHLTYLLRNLYEG